MLNFMLKIWDFIGEIPKIMIQIIVSKNIELLENIYKIKEIFLLKKFNAQFYNIKI